MHIFFRQGGSGAPHLTEQRMDGSHGD